MSYINYNFPCFFIDNPLKVPVAKPINNAM